MNIIELIEQKKQKGELSFEQLKFWIDGLVDCSIANYQTSAMLMAICLNGSSVEETYNLTKLLASSGEVLNFGEKSCDKHSTGGVGDSTTFVVLPVLASLGLSVGKMSGRGLGFTGGTIDKLESIPGFRVDLKFEDFLAQVEKINIAVVSQTKNMCVADKLLYALRDVTATVDSIPLIASSIMSKKLASGAKNIIIDIKCGAGAFMKTLSDAKRLKKMILEIGKRCELNVCVLITNMNAPLSGFVGNSLEVYGAIEVLRGKRNNLFEVSKKLTTILLEKLGEKDVEQLFDKQIDSGKAYDKFLEMVIAQGGDESFIKNTEKLLTALCKMSVYSQCSGYIESIDALSVAKIAQQLGGGRLKIDDKIDFGVGIKLLKQVGDKVEADEEIAELYFNNYGDISLIQDLLVAIKVSDKKVDYELFFE